MIKQHAVKPLSQSNRYLTNKVTARKMRVRSIASSTAIETQESIATIEAKLTRKRPSRYRVALA